MFSIVIPLYNKELSIESTIRSVLNQSFQDFEILVINDGSTDNSVKVIEKISDSRIRLINQNNQGVSAARNRGITEAQFEWIAFLDGDDLWLEDHLTEVIKIIAAFPAEKFFSTSFTYSDDRPLFKHKRNSTIFKVENYFKEATKELLVCTGTAVIHKECFNTVGLYNTSLKNGEDTELWNRMARKFDLVKSSHITAIYRIEAENRTTLSRHLESTYIYNIDFSKINDIAENNYFKGMIANRLYQYGRSKDIINFLKLKRKYPSITYIDIIQYTVSHISKRVLK